MPNGKQLLSKRVLAQASDPQKPHLIHHTGCHHLATAWLQVDWWCCGLVVGGKGRGPLGGWGPSSLLPVNPILLPGFLSLIWAFLSTISLALALASSPMSWTLP